MLRFDLRQAVEKLLTNTQTDMTAVQLGYKVEKNDPRQMNVLHLLTIFGLPTRMSLYGPDKIWNDYWSKLRGLSVQNLSSEKELGFNSVVNSV